MLSRVAETLYWTARYVERAENIARLVNVNSLFLMDVPKEASPGWEPLLDIIGARDAFFEIYQVASEKNVIKFLTVEKRNPSSIRNCISAARSNMRTVRDVVPKEVWEIVNKLDLEIDATSNDFLTKRGQSKSLEKVVKHCLLTLGAMEATMSHDDGFYFWRIGSLIERADMTSRIIDVRSAIEKDDDYLLPFKNIQWTSVLHSLSAYQMYRQRMGVRVRPNDVLDFVIYDERFPRSIYWCLNEIKRNLVKLPRSENLMLRVEHSISEIDESDVKEIVTVSLANFIDELQIDFADIHNTLAEQYF